MMAAFRTAVVSVVLAALGNWARAGDTPVPSPVKLTHDYPSWTGSGGLVLAGYFRPQDALVAGDLVVAVDAVTGKTRWKQVYKGKGINWDVGR